MLLEDRREFWEYSTNETGYCTRFGFPFFGCCSLDNLGEIGFIHPKGEMEQPQTGHQVGSTFREKNIDDQAIFVHRSVTTLHHAWVGSCQLFNSLSTLAAAGLFMGVASFCSFLCYHFS
jgi:hypothetical protein